MAFQPLQRATHQRKDQTPRTNNIHIQVSLYCLFRHKYPANWGDELSPVVVADKQRHTPEHHLHLWLSLDISIATHSTFQSDDNLWQFTTVKFIWFFPYHRLLAKYCSQPLSTPFNQTGRTGPWWCTETLQPRQQPYPRKTIIVCL